MAKEYKNKLSDVLNSLDKSDYKLYDKMSEEQKKDFQPFVLMRYMSCVPNNPVESMIALVVVNEYVNKYFWDLSSDKEFQAKLLASSGLGKKMYHQWIPNKTKNDNVLTKFIQEIFDNKNWYCNKTEMELFCRINDLESITNLCGEYGKSKDDQKKIIDQYKKIYM